MNLPRTDVLSTEIKSDFPVTKKKYISRQSPYPKCLRSSPHKSTAKELQIVETYNKMALNAAYDKSIFTTQIKEVNVTNCYHSNQIITSLKYIEIYTGFSYLYSNALIQQDTMPICKSK